MTGRIWDGRDVAQELLKRVRDEIVSLERERYAPPVLVAMWVCDPPFDGHLRTLQEEACRLTGVSHRVCAFPPLLSRTRSFERWLSLTPIAA